VRDGRFDELFEVLDHRFARSEVIVQAQRPGSLAAPGFGKARSDEFGEFRVNYTIMQL
jgi:hypothetical protein